MPIRYRLLLLLPLLVTLGIGSFGLFSIRLIRQNLNEAERTRVMQADAAAMTHLSGWTTASLDSTRNSALQFSHHGPLVSAPEWPDPRLVSSDFDFALVYSANGNLLNAWVRDREVVPQIYLDGWGEAIDAAMQTGPDWMFRSVAGEPTVVAYAPIPEWRVVEGGGGEEEPVQGTARGALLLGWRMDGPFLDTLANLIEPDVVLIGAGTGVPVSEPAREGTRDVFLDERVADWVVADVMGPQDTAATLEAGDRVLLGHALWRNGPVAGAWVMVSDIGAARQSVQALIDVLTVSLVLWLVIAAISAVLVGSSIANPIERLASAVGEMKSSELADLPVGRRDELGFLAKSLVEMHAEIQDQIGTLEGMHTQTRAALETRSRFLSSMSHELRTPLNAIIGMAEVLREPYWGELSADQEGFVDNIVDSARHLLTLINDILDVSRAEAGKVAAVPESISMAPLIVAVVGEQRILAEKAEIAVETECEEGATIWCDPRHARQILTNLLSNAIKYNRPGGKVTVRATRALEEGHTLVEVADTGIGIPEEEQERVFEAFSRQREAETSAQPGTGLGLALVRQLVQLNEGHVVLRSSADEGTTFHLVFPSARPQGKPQ